MFGGGQVTGQLGFGQQAGTNSMGIGGGAFGAMQQPQQGTGNPPFDATKVSTFLISFVVMMRVNTLYRIHFF